MQFVSYDKLIFSYWEYTRHTDSVYKCKGSSLVIKRLVDGDCLERLKKEVEMHRYVNKIVPDISPRASVLRCSPCGVYFYVQDMKSGDARTFLHSTSTARRLISCVCSKLVRLNDALHEQRDLYFLHGDLHLGNILHKGDDIFITDFNSSSFCAKKSTNDMMCLLTQMHSFFFWKGFPFLNLILSHLDDAFHIMIAAQGEDVDVLRARFGNDIFYDEAYGDSERILHLSLKLNDLSNRDRLRFDLKGTKAADVSWYQFASDYNGGAIFYNHFFTSEHIMSSLY